MPRIPLHTVDNAPEDSRDALKGLDARIGKVLNIHGHMAHSPVVLQSYVALQRVIGDYGTFDARTREAIALSVANVDDCGYCQAAHTASGKAAGLTVDQTVAVRRGDVDFDPKLAALLAVTRQATGNAGNVDDDIWQQAIDAGWTATDLTELSVHISLNLFTNYFNHMVGTEIDLPVPPAL